MCMREGGTDGGKWQRRDDVCLTREAKGKGGGRRISMSTHTSVVWGGVKGRTRKEKLISKAHRK